MKSASTHPALAQGLESAFEVWLVAAAAQSNNPNYFDQHLSQQRAKEIELWQSVVLVASGEIKASICEKVQAYMDIAGDDDQGDDGGLSLGCILQGHNDHTRGSSSSSSSGSNSNNIDDDNERCGEEYTDDDRGQVRNVQRVRLISLVLIS